MSPGKLAFDLYEITDLKYQDSVPSVLGSPGRYTIQSDSANSDRGPGGFDRLPSVLCTITGKTCTNIPRDPTVHTPIIAKKNMSWFISFHVSPFFRVLHPKKK